MDSDECFWDGIFCDLKFGDCTKKCDKWQQAEIAYNDKED